MSSTTTCECGVIPIESAKFCHMCGSTINEKGRIDAKASVLIKEAKERFSVIMPDNQRQDDEKIIDIQKSLVIKTAQIFDCEVSRKLAWRFIVHFTWDSRWAKLEDTKNKDLDVKKTRTPEFTEMLGWAVVRYFELMLEEPKQQWENIELIKQFMGCLADFPKEVNEFRNKLTTLKRNKPPDSSVAKIQALIAEAKETFLSLERGDEFQGKFTDLKQSLVKKIALIFNCEISKENAWEFGFHFSRTAWKITGGAKDLQKTHTIEYLETFSWAVARYFELMQTAPKHWGNKAQIEQYMKVLIDFPKEPGAFIKRLASLTYNQELDRIVENPKLEEEQLLLDDLQLRPPSDPPKPDDQQSQDKSPIREVNNYYRALEETKEALQEVERARNEFEPIRKSYEQIKKRYEEIKTEYEAVSLQYDEANQSFQKVTENFEQTSKKVLDKSRKDLEILIASADTSDKGIATLYHVWQLEIAETAIRNRLKELYPIPKDATPWFYEKPVKNHKYLQVCWSKTVEEDGEKLTEEGSTHLGNVNKYKLNSLAIT